MTPAPTPQPEEREKLVSVLLSDGYVFRALNNDDGELVVVPENVRRIAANRIAEHILTHFRSTGAIRDAVERARSIFGHDEDRDRACEEILKDLHLDPSTKEEE